MARIRTIKPEFWTDEKVGEVSLAARLVLIGALNFADDHGGLDRSSKQLKAQIFPYDTIDCEPLVLELIGAGLLIEYKVDDSKYLHIKGFHKHQRVDHPSKFPKTPPYSGGPSNPRESTSSTAEDSDKSKNAHRALANPRESSLSNGMEGNGEEGRGNTKNVRASEFVPRETISETALRECTETIKAKWPPGCPHEDWITAERLIRNLIAGGTLADDIEAGVERYAKYCKAVPRIIANPGKWFAEVSRPWLSPWTVAKTKTETTVDVNLENSREWLEKSNAH